MKKPIWPEELTKGSFEFVKRLAAVGLDFILIGGWAAYFHAKHQQSKDIDLMIKDANYWKLKQYVISNGGMEKESGLRKYGFKIGDVEIDAYTETMGELPINVNEVFSKQLFIEKEGLKVISPEALIVLKLVAEKNRHDSPKGLKDRCDILAILMLEDLNVEKLKDLLRSHGMNEASDQLRSIIKASEAEFNQYLLDQPRIPSKLKQLKKTLLAKLEIR